MFFQGVFVWATWARKKAFVQENVCLLDKPVFPPMAENSSKAQQRLGQ